MPTFTVIGSGQQVRAFFGWMMMLWIMRCPKGPGEKVTQNKYRKVTHDENNSRN